MRLRRPKRPGNAPACSAPTHNFIGELGKVAPYGVYDVGANTGWVNVGTDADTGAFAVESIRRASQTVTSNKAFGWWGEERQPQQSRTEPSPGGNEPIRSR